MVISAAARYPEIVSRRTPVFLSISRKDQPSWPNARTCSLFVSLKTLLIRAGAPLPPATGQRLSAQLAAFAEITTGRIWVITEATGLANTRLFIWLTLHINSR